LADGEICFNDDDFEGALAYYREAFKLIPKPVQDHGESTQVIAAIADCLYAIGDAKKAATELVCAYINGGFEVFDGED